jgi:hypothetical protein
LVARGFATIAVLLAVVWIVQDLIWTDLDCQIPD